jgi:hypothetical protein
MSVLRCVNHTEICNQLNAWSNINGQAEQFRTLLSGKHPEQVMGIFTVSLYDEPVLCFYRKVVNV